MKHLVASLNQFCAGLLISALVVFLNPISSSAQGHGDVTVEVKPNGHYLTYSIRNSGKNNMDVTVIYFRLPSGEKVQKEYTVNSLMEAELSNSQLITKPTIVSQRALIPQTSSY